MGSVSQLYFLAQMFVFALQTFLPLRRCPFYMSAFFSLPSFSRAGWGWVVAGCPCVASRGQSRAGGVGEPLVARSVHGSSLLSPRFIRGLGIQELLCGGELLLPVLSQLALPPQLCTLGEVLGWESFRGRSLFSVASPASFLHAQRGGGAGESPECRSS